MSSPMDSLPAIASSDSLDHPALSGDAFIVGSSNSSVTNHYSISEAPVSSGRASHPSDSSPSDSRLSTTSRIERLRAAANLFGEPNRLSTSSDSTHSRSQQPASSSGTSNRAVPSSVISAVGISAGLPSTLPVAASVPFFGHTISPPLPSVPSTGRSIENSASLSSDPSAKGKTTSSTQTAPSALRSLHPQISRMECGVCFNRFSPTRRSRHPIVAACGHSFCRSCAPQLRSRCATCRRLFIGERNYSLIDALEEVNELKSKVKILAGMLREAGHPVAEEAENSESEESETGEDPIQAGEIIVLDDDDEPPYVLPRGAPLPEGVIVIDLDDDQDNNPHPALLQTGPQLHRYPTRLSLRRQQEEAARRQEEEEERREAEIRNDIVAQLQQRQEELVRQREILDRHERELFRALLGYINHLDAPPLQQNLLDVD